jgi:hypothetical protein
LSLLVAAFAQFELSDPWQIKTTDSSLIYKKPKSGKSKIRKLVQVSRKNGIHWRSQLVDAIETREKKLGTAASKLSADLKRIAVNNPTNQVGMNAKPITQFEQIGLTAPKKVLQTIAAQTPKNNNRLVLALSGLSAIGTAGLYLNHRSKHQ